MKKISIVGAAVLLSTVTLTSCVNNNPINSNSSSNSGGTSDSVSITFWHTFGQSIVETLEKKIGEFQDIISQNEGIQVNISLSYSGSYDDILTKINNGFAAGNIPTIAVAYPDHVADYMSRETYDGQYLVNLDSFINNEEYGFGTQDYLGDERGEEDFVEAYWAEGVNYAKEGTYSIPLMKSSEVMFYNYEAVATALSGSQNFVGYSPEDGESYASVESFLEDLSWDEFMDFCLFINTNSRYILSTLETPAYYDSDGNLFVTKMYQNEIPYATVDGEGNGFIGFEKDPELSQAKAMVTKLKQQFDQNLFTTKGVKGTYGSNSFTEMKSIFSIGSTGGTGYNVPTSGSFTVGVVKVPYDNNNPLYVSQGPTLCIMNNPNLSAAENTLRQEYAWKFIKYLTNADNNVELCINGSNGYTPVRYSAYESDNFIAFLESGDIYSQTALVTLDDIGENFVDSPAFKGSATLREQGGSILASVFANTKDVDTAFTDAINETLIAME